MDGTICVICTEPINPAFSLLSPCCEKTWVHPNCLEKSQDNSDQFFKCPACTVKGETKESDGVLQEVELHREEPAELNDFVKVEVGCCADECLCDEGRTRSRVGTQWEVVVCDVCTSAGTHKRCSDVQLITDQWQCLTCQHITVKLDDSCDVPRESANVEAVEIFSYLPLQVCKTEIDEDVGCSAYPDIVKSNGTIKSTLQRTVGKGNECFDVTDKSDSCIPKKRKLKRRRKTFKCDFEGCDAAYNRTSDLLMHCRTHIDKKNNNHSPFRSHIDVKPYKCDYDGCDAAYGRSSHLARHSVTHTNVKPYKCDYDGCGAAFNQSSTLQTHRLRHSNEKPYKCFRDGCYAAFNRISHLKSHDLTHTNEKPHKCDYNGCGAAFSCSSNLSRHHRSHTKEKPYKCHYDGCDVAFSASSDLIRHHRTHTKEKPYKCDYDGCNAAFSRKSDLIRHQDNGISVHKNMQITAE